jgi:flagellar operon protein
MNIDIEYERLKSLFYLVEESRTELVDNLIYQAAFMKVELDKLSTGVEKARNKGARDSLVMVNNVAYIVSVENNTVVTAVDEDSMDDNVLTNIDSAVFMK